MAKFDESKVINALHSEKAEEGKKYYRADTLTHLKDFVTNEQTDFVFELAKIDVGTSYPFVSEIGYSYQFLYPYEEPREQRMTNRQFCEWNDKGNGQWKWKDYTQCHTGYSYSAEMDNEEVEDNIVIRSWDSDKWVEPTLDIYLRDCKGGK